MKIQHFLSLFLFLFPFFLFSQTESNLKELVCLYQENNINQKRINAILKDDPELGKLLKNYSNEKISQAKKQKTESENPLLQFGEEYFKLEGEKIKLILSENNLNGIKELFYTVQNSEYAKDISYIVLRQMEIAKEELEVGIKNLPKHN